MKIVINKNYGGFHLSKDAVLLYGEKKGLNIIATQDEVIKDLYHYYLNEEKYENGFAEWDIERNDPVLVEVPDDVKWYIHDYDGIESVYEKHRIWD